MANFYYYNRWNSEHAFREWKTKSKGTTHRTIETTDAARLENLVADRCEDPGNARYIRIERKGPINPDVNFETIRDNIEDYCKETAKCKVQSRQPANTMLIRFTSARDVPFVRSIEDKNKG